MDFTQEEWDNCIKVLKVLVKEPNKGLDINMLKGLVTKINKQAKKQNKAKKLQEKAEVVLSSAKINSSHKIQKVIETQDVYKQYDKSLIAGALLFKNYEQKPVQIIENQPVKGSLIYSKKCYICKVHYSEVHFFYHSLCPNCADFNYKKRSVSSDLSNRVALITGGRIKIGYLTALKLLRDGAKVWVTTRFAHDCAKRFSQEPDFNKWSNRLKIVSLDFRNLKALQDFIDYFLIHEKHLDILINNAAQTVRRPYEFYEHLFETERVDKYDLPIEWQSLLPLDTSFSFLKNAWEQKLLPYEAEKYFPQGLFDKDNQQIDHRDVNSWTLKLHQVPVLEMLETQLVNVTAPFMLNSLLKPLLEKSPFDRRFIINVSAMEGQFNRSSKTPFHPHTNMAKAALNMMTRTSAQDYAASHIFMNSVDTGWITQENPYPKKERLYNDENFVPPLDEYDGMARIYDPIASGINNNEIPLFGHFLKDYKPYLW